MSEPESLSSQAIQDEYEDLVFCKVMSAYAVSESARISAEADSVNVGAEASAGIKAVDKLFGRIKFKRNLYAFGCFSRKAVSAAAMIVFVAVITLVTSVSAFADVRENVAKAFYNLLSTDYGTYTEVKAGETGEFIDREVFTAEGIYAPTYIPEGYELTVHILGGRIVKYDNKETDTLTISQKNSGGIIHLDTENAQLVERVMIGESEALLVVKDNFTHIVWHYGSTLFSVKGYNLPTEEAIKTAKGLKPVA